MSSQYSSKIVQITTLLESWGLYHINRYIEQHHFHKKSIFSNSTQRANVLSFLIGFTAALITALADIFFLPQITSNTTQVIIILACINLAVMIVEFWLLFHISFQTIAQYIRIIGQYELLDNEIKQSLVRAVIELDEPKIKRFGLNPYKYQKKYYGVMILLYKAKVIMTNFVAKIVIRKLLSRGGLRTYTPLISTIITGYWDFWVQNSVLKEVRFRLLGRLSMIKLCHDLQKEAYSPLYLEALIRTTAVRIELFGVYNINMDYLINQLNEFYNTPINDINELYNPVLITDILTQLSPTEQQKLSNNGILLMALKCSKLSKKEQEFMNILKIEDADVTQAREHYNDFFKGDKNIFI